MPGVYDYTIPFRPNFSLYAALGWAISIPVSLLAMRQTDLPPMPFQVYVGVSIVMCLWYVPGAIASWRARAALRGAALSYYTPRDLKRRLDKRPGSLWFGRGFEWGNHQTQLAYEILKRDVRDIMPERYRKGLGARWIHGIADDHREFDLYQEEELSTLMTLIVGSTGSGKTRMFETIITSCALRGHAVIVLDPKGDRGLAEAARNAAALASKPEAYKHFHPGFADHSVRLDPLRNFNAPTEIASRIAQVLPEGSDSGPFKAFGFMAINNVVQGLLFSGHQPTLVKIRSYLEGGAVTLVHNAITNYLDYRLPGWDRSATRNEYLKGKELLTRTRNLIAYYRQHVQPKHPSSDLEGLLSLFEHDSAHLQKMIASTLPILNALTSGAMGPLLSPDPEMPEPGAAPETNAKDIDTRPIENTQNIIDKGHILYMGLDSLSNNMVGAALGSIFLADLASVAGRIYNGGERVRPISVFVDEASEALCDSLIQLLNKSRGSGFSLYVATQTMADFTAALGDEAKARQVLGNLNNLIALRTIDNETQEYITANLPMTRVKYLMHTQGTNTDSGSAITHGGNIGERLMEEESELFPPQLLGMLPNLEYIAKFAGGRVVKGRIPILRQEGAKNA